jgi:thymidylate synthase
MSTTLVWKRALMDLLHSGVSVSPMSAGATWRGRANRELVAYQTTIDMSNPVVLSPGRKLGYKFMCAEAAWILSGDNRVSTIAPYAKAIKDLSDDGRRYFGAYGPKFVDQLSFVVDTLVRDPASRQAVVNIWREQPRPSKDTPCTLSWQFLIRGGKLHCVATMRSSDIWTGWVYDIFNFSMAAAVVALELRGQASKILSSQNAELLLGEQKTTLAALRELELGYLTLTAGSQHLYQVDSDGAQACLNEASEKVMRSLNLAEFQTSDDLIAHLWACARGQWSLQSAHFLGELFG